MRRDPNNELDYPEGPYNDNFLEMGYESVNFLDTLSDMFYYELIFISFTIAMVVIVKFGKIGMNESSKVQQFEGGENEIVISSSK